MPIARGGRKRKYHDHERWTAIELARAVGSLQASKDLGIPRQNIESWMKGFHSANVLELWQLKKGDLAQAYEDAIWDALAFLREKISEATYSQLVLAACQMTDKMRLLREQSTANQQSRSVVVNANLNLDPGRLTPRQRLDLERLMQAAKVPNGSDGGAKSGASGVVREATTEVPLSRQSSEICADGLADPEPR